MKEVFADIGVGFLPTSLIKGIFAGIGVGSLPISFLVSSNRDGMSFISRLKDIFLASVLPFLGMIL